MPRAAKTSPTGSPGIRGRVKRSVSRQVNSRNWHSNVERQWMRLLG